MGGSKAVLNFSENSSDLVARPFPKKKILSELSHLKGTSSKNKIGMAPFSSHVPPGNKVHFSTRGPRVFVYITKFAIQIQINVYRVFFFTGLPLKVSEFPKGLALSHF